MNKAHEECIELLQIVHGICKKENLKYTIASNTLIAYENGVEFEKCAPIIYIALMYRHFVRLKEALCGFCSEHSGYSFHDYTNTEQFDTFESWFVKESRSSFGRTGRRRHSIMERV